MQLEPQRAVGGRLAAGDHVGVFVSQALPDGTVQTHAVLHHVLVTQVQGAVVPTTGTAAAGPSGTQTAAASSSASSSGSSSTVLVTLALTAQDAEAVVFGAGARQGLAVAGAGRGRHRRHHGRHPGQHLHRRTGVLHEPGRAGRRATRS